MPFPVCGSCAFYLSQIRAILAKEGVRGLYAGYGAFLLRDLPFDAIEFVAYEQLRKAAAKILQRDPNPVEVSLVGAVAGGFTGASGWGVLLVLCCSVMCWLIGNVWCLYGDGYLCWVFNSKFEVYRSSSMCSMPALGQKENPNTTTTLRSGFDAVSSVSHSSQTRACHAVKRSHAHLLQTANPFVTLP